MNRQPQRARSRFTRGARIGMALPRPVDAAGGPREG